MNMDFACKVETGIQVLARLIQPPSLVSLQPNLIPNGPVPLQVIEISYENDSPQDAILCDLISNAVLPIEYGGKCTSVAILLTDGHFEISTLAKMLDLKLKMRYNYDGDDVEALIKKCLSRVYIIQVYDSQEMFITIQSFEGLFATNADLSLMIVDTISAFYWSDRLNGKGILKMDLYVKKILRALQVATKEYKPVIIYTKPSYFVSKSVLSNETEQCSQDIGMEKINYKILIKKNIEEKEVPDLYNISIEDFNCTVLKYFYFKDNEIHWM